MDATTKYSVIQEFWFKKHNKIYHVGETGNFNAGEAKLLLSQGHIRLAEEKNDSFREYNTKPSKVFRTKEK